MVTKADYRSPLCSELKVEMEGAILSSSVSGTWKETEIDFINGSGYGLE